MRWFVLAIALLGCQKKERAASEAPAAAICASDADCVFVCAGQGECCDRPACDVVLHTQAAAAVAAFNNQHCSDAERAKCTQPAARPPTDDVLVARCSAGTCTADRVSKTSAAWQNPLETVSSAGFDRTCQTADDCKIVDELPCNHCNCGSVAIAARDSERWNQASGAIRCGPQPKIQCSECRGFVAACEANTCKAVPAP